MLEQFYKNEKIEKINRLIVMISLVMLCTIPLIMYRYDSISYSPIFMSNTYATGAKSDVFNFFKALILNIGSFSILGLIFYKIIKLKEEIKYSTLNVVIFIFAAFIIISPLVSKYKDIALFGNFDRHEGAITWISYLTILFALYNTKIESKYYKYFYYALVPFIVVNLILGTLNVIGINILDNKLVNNMLGGGLGGFLATTLYHPNFGSAVSSIIFSISFIYLLLEKDKKMKIILLVITVVSFATVLVMLSSGGFLTLLAVLPISLVIGVRFTNTKNVIKWTSIVFVLNCISYMVLSVQNKRVYEESLELLVKINNISVAIIPVAIITFVFLVFIMKFINRKKVFNIIVGIVIIATIVGGVAFSIAIEKEHKILRDNPDANIVRIKDTGIYNKINDVSTARLNIWMKSVDLINDRPLFGHGFDTYPYVIIQSDEDAGMSNLGEYIDKPHSWYLNVAYGSGVVSLAALILIIIYIVKGIFDNISDKKENKFLYVYGVGAIAYAIQGMLNDSFVGTAIVFWVLTGVCANIIDNIKSKDIYKDC